MYYVRDHAIDRYIERVEDVPREVAKNNIMETMLFPEKETSGKYQKAFLKNDVIVIADFQGDDLLAVTTISRAQAHQFNWWYTSLLS